MKRLLRTVSFITSTNFFDFSSMLNKPAVETIANSNLVDVKPIFLKAPPIFSLISSLAAEGGEVLKRFDTRKEEVGTTLHGRESG